MKTNKSLKKTFNASFQGVPLRFRQTEFGWLVHLGYGSGWVPYSKRDKNEKEKLTLEISRAEGKRIKAMLAKFFKDLKTKRKVLISKLGKGRIWISGEPEDCFDRPFVEIKIRVAKRYETAGFSIRSMAKLAKML